MTTSGAAPAARREGQSEERLRLVVEATRAGIWDIDLGSGDNYVSERFEEIMGYRSGEGPRSLTAFVHHVVPEHRQRVLDLMSAAVTNGTPYAFDCRIREARGEIRWLHVRGTVQCDTGLQPSRIVGIIVDTTAENSARTEREAQERFLAGVNAALPLIVYVYDSLAQRLLFANRPFGELLGYTDAELATFAETGLHAILHPDDRAVVSENRARIAMLAEGQADTIRLRIRHRDGGWRWVRSRNTPLRLNKEGTLWQLLGTAEDITDQVLAEERLRDQERELARAQEIARVGSWTWNFASQSLSWSREMYRIVDLDPDTVQPSEAQLESRITAEDRARLRAAHERCAAGGPTVDERITLALPDGSRRLMHVLCEMLRLPDGTAHSFVGTMQDITDQMAQQESRRQLEAQVHQAQKLESLGLLAGGIAHDFNNLLVGVLSNASLALLELDDEAPARTVVYEIERTAQRAADLTRQLLAYSGKGRFVVEPLDLSALATEMAQLLRTVVSKDAVLQLQLAESLPLIEADATQLRQVIMNLITNASDALGDKPGTITIVTAREPTVGSAEHTFRFGELRPVEHAVFLEVRDTGAGMTAEVAEKIFDPFFSTKFTGRGLGLAATLGIVRGHKGHITVTSVPGQGTQVSLGFPATATPASQTLPPTEARAFAGSGEALVVDDDRVVRTVASALLLRRGFRVAAAPNGLAALELLADEPERFRFVLLDLTMPGLSGIEVLRALRERERLEQRPPATVFLMSGYSELEVSNDLGELAVAGFLQKPFTLTDVDRLLSVLRTHAE